MQQEWRMPPCPVPRMCCVALAKVPGQWLHVVFSGCSGATKPSLMIHWGTVGDGTLTGVGARAGEEMTGVSSSRSCRLKGKKLQQFNQPMPWDRETPVDSVSSGTASWVPPGPMSGFHKGWLVTVLYNRRPVFSSFGSSDPSARPQDRQGPPNLRHTGHTPLAEPRAKGLYLQRPTDVWHFGDPAPPGPVVQFPHQMWWWAPPKTSRSAGD